MRERTSRWILPLLLLGFLQPQPGTGDLQASCNSSTDGTIYDYGALTLDGSRYVSFQEYAGKNVLFVNVATY